MDLNQQLLHCIRFGKNPDSLHRAESLIKKGANANYTCDLTGDPLLHKAVKTATEDMVSLLLANGAKIENKDKDGWTPLMHAVLNDDVNMISHLLTKKAKKESKDNAGQTPLSIACSMSRFESARTLINQGANINTFDRFTGQTPLMKACSSWSPRQATSSIVLLLLKNGANARRKSHEGKVALDYFNENKEFKCPDVEVALKNATRSWWSFF